MSANRRSTDPLPPTPPQQESTENVAHQRLCSADTTLQLFSEYSNKKVESFLSHNNPQSSTDLHFFIPQPYTSLCCKTLDKALVKKQSNPKACRPIITHSSRSGHSTPVSIILSQQRAYTPALWLGGLNNVGGRLQLSLAICHFYVRQLCWST